MIISNPKKKDQPKKPQENHQTKPPTDKAIKN